MHLEKKHIFLGLVRIGLGIIFLWAFLDKTFGFGFATTPEHAWLAGGSPTSGFLLNGTHGPFALFYQSLANIALIDWVFMIGLLLLGIALITGIGIRIASISGFILMVLMYTAAMPPENNPLIDEHIIYALILLSFVNINKIGYWIGFGNMWSKTKLVKKFKFLQ